MTGKPPSLAFIDRKTKRVEERGMDVVSKFEYVTYFKNAQGTLNIEEFGEVISELLLNLSSNTPSLVIVEGEEDMLSLAVPLFVNYRGAVLMYGQPNMGVVVIQLDAENSVFFSELIASLKPEFSFSAQNSIDTINPRP